ncbi:MAG: hypothetical protein KKD38_02345, partial [Candidatus Delongbacteria bacterium]|nr:hypothetical protein [Candidatus Delongbacteria bacterium]
MEEKNMHPNIKNFSSAVKNRTLDDYKISTFEKFLMGEKCPDDQKEFAKELLDKARIIVNTIQPQKIIQPNVNKGGGFKKSFNGHSNSQSKGQNSTAAEPSCIGESFTNPYHFIPFPKSAPKRSEPTSWSVDEIDKDRITGILELNIATLSPLSSCNPMPDDSESIHKSYGALKIDCDVIVPATGIKGSLRSLMTILSGGTLGYMDEHLWLCQGRDLRLGPSKTGDAPKNVFLGLIEDPGNDHKIGKIRLGETELVTENNLKQLISDFDRQRPKPGSTVKHFWIDDPKNPKKFDTKQTEECKWMVKLSGRTPNQRGVKKEGAFKPGNTVISIQEKIWADYHGRNRHSDFSELRKGMLVWLEPNNFDIEKIEKPEQIKSIQWARWGRGGIRFEDQLQKQCSFIIPDSKNIDGKVDEITNLFGHVPINEKAASSFAGRLRFENMVFANCEDKLEKVTLAPLMNPHPGCTAFYRQNENLDLYSINDPLRGYKIYRTTSEKGNDAPWLYKNQGVYDGNELKVPLQKLNKTCELLSEGVDGKLNIACHALTKRELALLILSCSVDWRIGAGKPLGLGHCKVHNIKFTDEDLNEVFNLSGDFNSLPDEWLKYLNQEELERAKQYLLLMKPVDKLRYPRAVNISNKSRATISGHIWFSRHAAPKKTGNKGLETRWTSGELKDKAGGFEQIKAQPLNDQLYGYDEVIAEQTLTKDR